MLSMFFFYYKITKTNRTQHVTIIFNFDQIFYPNQVILLLCFLLQQNYKNETKHNMLQLLSNQT